MENVETGTPVVAHATFRDETGAPYDPATPKCRWGVPGTTTTWTYPTAPQFVRVVEGEYEVTIGTLGMVTTGQTVTGFAVIYDPALAGDDIQPTSSDQFRVHPLPI